jgi:hypothetical protein
MRLLRQPALPPKPADQLYQSGCQIADRLNLDCMVITRMIGTEPDSAGNQERTVLLRRGVPTALDPPQSAARPIALPRDRADHLLIGSVIAANVVTHLAALDPVELLLGQPAAKSKAGGSRQPARWLPPPSLVAERCGLVSGVWIIGASMISRNE